MTTQRKIMQAIDRHVQRDGRYRPEAIWKEQMRCDHCHLKRRLKHRLCRECRHLLAVQ